MPTIDVHTKISKELKMNIKEYLQGANGKQIFDYPGFINWVTQLAEHGATSGLNQSESLVNFTQLNLKRMQRIEKTFRLNDELTALLKAGLPNQQWLVITEAWCGDSAQILPILNKIAENAPGKIRLSIVLRDQNHALMEKYHTNGSKSIPKLIASDTEGRELFTWGPRPAPAQKLLVDWKQNPQGRLWDDFEKELHTWYARDKGNRIQTEFVQIFQQIQNINLAKAA